MSEQVQANENETRDTLLEQKSPTKPKSKKTTKTSASTAKNEVALSNKNDNLAKVTKSKKAKPAPANTAEVALVSSETKPQQKPAEKAKPAAKKITKKPVQAKASPVAVAASNEKIEATKTETKEVSKPNINSIDSKIDAASNATVVKNEMNSTVEKVVSQKNKNLKNLKNKAKKTNVVPEAKVATADTKISEEIEHKVIAKPIEENKQSQDFNNTKHANFKNQNFDKNKDGKFEQKPNKNDAQNQVPQRPNPKFDNPKDHQKKLSNNEKANLNNPNYQHKLNKELALKLANEKFQAAKAEAKIENFVQPGNAQKANPIQNQNKNIQQRPNQNPNQNPNKHQRPDSKPEQNIDAANRNVIQPKIEHRNDAQNVENAKQNQHQNQNKFKNDNAPKAQEKFQNPKSEVVKTEVAVEKQVAPQATKEANIKQNDSRNQQQNQPKANNNNPQNQQNQKVNQTKNETFENKKNDFREEKRANDNPNRIKAQNINKSKLISESDSHDRVIKNMLTKVEDFLKNKLYVDREVRVLLAVSGGVDSITMLDVFANLAYTYKFELHIAHLNHKLRNEDSDKDEKFVKQVTESYNLPFHSATANVQEIAEKKSLSIEQAAREVRYNFLEKVSSNIKTNFVVTAHNADDSAETFLMNLFRGSGLTGLSGIPSKRLLQKNVYLIRPLIEIKKAELMEYARKRSLTWVEDKTNKDIKFTRNKIRHDLIPKLIEDYSPAIIDILNRTARHINGAERYVTGNVKDYLEQVTNEIDEHRISIKIPLLDTYNAFIQGEILQAAFAKYYALQPVSLTILDKILDLKKKDAGTFAEVHGDIVALKDRETILILRREEPKKIHEIFKRTGTYRFGKYELKLSQVRPEDVVIDDNPMVEYLDMEFLPQKLCFRNWEKGDYFKPLGMNGNTVKIADFLASQKVPVIDKNRVFVLTDRYNILWVCGFRISDSYKVTSESTEILRVELIDHSFKKKN